MKTQEAINLIKDLKHQSQLDAELRGNIFNYKSLISAWVLFNNGRKSTVYSYELQNSIQQIKHRGHIPLIDFEIAIVNLKNWLQSNQQIKMSQIYFKDFKTGKTYKMFEQIQDEVTQDDFLKIKPEYIDEYSQYLQFQFTNNKAIINYSNKKEVIL